MVYLWSLQQEDNAKQKKKYDNSTYVMFCCHSYRLLSINQTVPKAKNIKLFYFCDN